MTGYDEWLKSQTKEFRQGFTAYWCRLEHHSSSSQWHKGYEEAHRKDLEQQHKPTSLKQISQKNVESRKLFLGEK